MMSYYYISVDIVQYYEEYSYNIVIPTCLVKWASLKLFLLSYGYNPGNRKQGEILFYTIM